MEKHNYHIRLSPYAVALVDERCPKETIDALLKMSELALKKYEDDLELTEQGVSKKYEDKSSLTSKAASGGDGLVNLQTPPSCKFYHQCKNESYTYKEQFCGCYQDTVKRDIELIMFGMAFFREDLDLTNEENIGYATRYYKSLRAAGKI